MHAKRALGQSSRHFGQIWAKQKGATATARTAADNMNAQRNQKCLITITFYLIYQQYLVIFLPALPVDMFNLFMKLIRSHKFFINTVIPSVGTLTTVAWVSSSTATFWARNLNFVYTNLWNLESLLYQYDSSRQRSPSWFIDSASGYRRLNKCTPTHTHIEGEGLTHTHTLTTHKASINRRQNKVLYSIGGIAGSLVRLAESTLTAENWVHIEIKFIITRRRDEKGRQCGRWGMVSLLLCKTSRCPSRCRVSPLCKKGKLELVGRQLRRFMWSWWLASGLPNHFSVSAAHPRLVRAAHMPFGASPGNTK